MVRVGAVPQVGFHLRRNRHGAIPTQTDGEIRILGRGQIGAIRRVVDRREVSGAVIGKTGILVGTLVNKGRIQAPRGAAAAAAVLLRVSAIYQFA